MQRARALVVDRDPNVRSVVGRCLEKHDISSYGTETAAEALKSLRSDPFRLLFVDSAASGLAGTGLVSLARQLQQPPLIVTLTGERSPSPEDADLAESACDDIEKPIDERKLEAAVRRCVRQLGLMAELGRVRESLERREGFAGLVGRSETMLRLRAELQGLASDGQSIWFSGEPGSGRETAARFLHDSSAMAALPFVRVRGDRPLPKSLLAELAADGGTPRGTLYIGEVEDLAADDRSRLEDLLGTSPAGPGHATLRLVVGSKHDPLVAIEQGHQLEPLYRRMVPAHVPLAPLRRRPEDVLVLARHFVKTIGEINSLPAIGFSAEAAQHLQAYSWPGNVRELRNAVEHAAILAVEGTIRPRDLPEKVTDGPPAGSTGARSRPLADRRFRDVKREVVERFEVAYLRDLLERHRGNVTAASHQAGMLRSALQRLLRKYSLRSAEFRSVRDASPSRPSDGARATE